jgi:hypothetical protein
MIFSIFLPRLPLENMLLNLRSMFDMWRQENNEGICKILKLNMNCQMYSTIMVKMIIIMERTSCKWDL